MQYIASKARIQSKSHLISARALLYCNIIFSSCRVALFSSPTPILAARCNIPPPLFDDVVSTPDSEVCWRALSACGLEVKAEQDDATATRDRVLVVWSLKVRQSAPAVIIDER